MTCLVEYIWLDGTTPTTQIRSKTKVLHDEPIVETLPQWKFDGSSTNQATGDRSDCILQPVFMCKDPIRGKGNFLALCEVLTERGQPHPTNTRNRAVRASKAMPTNSVPWAAMEQEYFIMDIESNLPVGFWSLPDDDGLYWEVDPAMRRQGPYYCSVGGDVAFGRDLAEEHLRACIDAGLDVTGINAEVAPGQWEIQVGGPHVFPLSMADQLWVARWLLHRIAEKHRGIDGGRLYISLEPKPVPGDWNGSGCHTNFSTRETRELGGMAAIVNFCEKLGHPDRITAHLAVYGHGIEHRLTGKHETCSYREFKYGVSDRTASVRIPIDVEKAGAGYLEDRRPNANCDPYLVVSALMETYVWNPPAIKVETEE